MNKKRPNKYTNYNKKKYQELDQIGMGPHGKQQLANKKRSIKICSPSLNLCGNKHK